MTMNTQANTVVKVELLSGAALADALDSMSGPELVSTYNRMVADHGLEPDFNKVRKFATRSVGVHRCTSLALTLGAGKVAEIMEVDALTEEAPAVEDVPVIEDTLSIAPVVDVPVETTASISDVPVAKKTKIKKSAAGNRAGFVIKVLKTLPACKPGSSADAARIATAKSTTLGEYLAGFAPGVQTRTADWYLWRYVRDGFVSVTDPGHK
jgi:hypothetical protein